MSEPPSAWRIQQVLAIVGNTLNRMEAEGTLATDEADLVAALREETPEVDALLLRLVRAQDEAKWTAEAINDRIGDLTIRRNRANRRHDEYRRAIYGILDVMGLKNWRSAEFSVSTSMGKPGVVITDEAALPAEFVRVERTPDKTAIANALRAAQDVPGAELGNAAPQLTIRTK